MSFSIFTDNHANLPESVITKYDVNVIPFSYFKDGTEYSPVSLDDVDFDEYYAELRSGVKITTSQINPQRYIEYNDNAGLYVRIDPGSGFCGV